ncbi:hypothetical protein [Cryptosporangium sp. NPDC051539]|uniref:hypothetical protein n=1 Tax=Cryptosporangium sp. NPDC051539 TaxID=3363962 RepID=UPI0037BA1E67
MQTYATSRHAELAAWADRTTRQFVHRSGGPRAPEPSIRWSAHLDASVLWYLEQLHPDHDFWSLILLAESRISLDLDDTYAFLREVRIGAEQFDAGPSRVAVVESLDDLFGNPRPWDEALGLTRALFAELSRDYLQAHRRQ